MADVHHFVALVDTLNQVEEALAGVCGGDGTHGGRWRISTYRFWYGH
jgi:hypothetical protein